MRDEFVGAGAVDATNHDLPVPRLILVTYQDHRDWLPFSLYRTVKLVWRHSPFVISSKAVPHVNGKRVKENHPLAPEDWVEFVEEGHLKLPDDDKDVLTIKQVSEILGCSYGEARNRMLDGRIKCIKDGRWIRSRRDWLDEYIASQKIEDDPEKVALPSPSSKRKRASASIKPNGIAMQFLKDRKK